MIMTTRKHPIPFGRPVPAQDPARLLESYRRGLLQRLRPLCADMPAEQFDSMLSDMCDFRIRWALREQDERESCTTA